VPGGGATSLTLNLRPLWPGRIIEEAVVRVHVSPFEAPVAFLAGGLFCCAAGGRPALHVDGIVDTLYDGVSRFVNPFTKDDGC
jgi:hypothetical protein